MRGIEGLPRWVAPFGNPGIIARWQLPQAYRSLLRPSSPVVPRYPPVCSYVLTKTRSRNTILKLQSTLCAWTRSHVWHMKVLLYAVFKVRGSVPRDAGDRIGTSESRSSRIHPLKAEQYSLLMRLFCRSASSLSRSRSLDRFASLLLALDEKFTSKKHPSLNGWRKRS